MARHDPLLHDVGNVKSLHTLNMRFFLSKVSSSISMTSASTTLSTSHGHGYIHIRLPPKLLQASLWRSKRTAPTGPKSALLVAQSSPRLSTTSKPASTEPRRTTPDPIPIANRPPPAQSDLRRPTNFLWLPSIFLFPCSFSLFSVLQGSSSGHRLQLPNRHL